MGFNTVAVLYNDHIHRMAEDDGRIARDIGKAMQHWSMRDRDRMATWFGCGQVVSQAHADYSQVVVVGQNSGRPLSECKELDRYAIDQLVTALVQHGYKVTAPKRKKSA
jgi:DNA-directed RNA polymerase subunit N (RpoN/RPB10)